MSKGIRIKRRTPIANKVIDDGRPKCLLCGKTENLTKTECCDNWICDDEGNYVLFSYADNSCHRNHRRYTLCGQHYESGHEGKWQDCEECKTTYQTEMYVYFGTNEYNVCFAHLNIYFHPSSSRPGYKCATAII